MPKQMMYTTTIEALYGYKAVLIEWDEEEKEYVPVEVGYYQYANPEEAKNEAKRWARDYGIEFKN